MWTYFTKLVVDFHNFANAPKKRRNMKEGVDYKEKLRCVNKVMITDLNVSSFYGATAQIGPRPPCLRFLDHTHTHTVRLL
jgi:hypothetical protein